MQEIRGILLFLNKYFKGRTMLDRQMKATE